MNKIDWSTEKNFKDQVSRLWERGDLLREKLKELDNHQTNIASVFPLRLNLKSPSSSELGDRFDEVRQWIAQLSAIKLLHIEWRELNHRVLGKQKVPLTVSLTSLDDAITFIAKRKEEKQFIEIVSNTQNAHPELLTWLQKRPLQAISLHQVWPHLLAVVTWMKQHPQPGIYLRQIDIAGIHSKFIEVHRRVLSELFDLALPSTTINHEHTGINQFAARYGFLDKPQRIRFRSLDTQLNFIAGTTSADISLDAGNFAKLALAGKRIFITENETNFLAIPPVQNALIIFGAGYGWDALAQANWLHHCDIYYWGDIDTHGFAILNQLRYRFPHVRSFLMDENTLLAHQSLWGREEQTVTHTLSLLNEEEEQLCKRLQNHSLQDHLRLEQEHIRFSALLEALAVINKS